MAPYAMLRSAIDRGDLAEVTRLARAVSGDVRLHDALRIVLLMRGADPDRYDRAAVRWIGRFALEARGATVSDLHHAAEALDLLPDQPEVATEVLARLCARRGVA
jgi:hypothetical protein